MVAITPDSPIGAVFGNSHKKRKLAEEGLGLRTVGDLLRHFPRRYVAAAELTEVATPVVGEQLTIVGEVRSCESAPFFSGNRRQFRTTVRLRTEGPDFSITLFSPYANQAERHEAEFRPGTRAIFTGKVKQFRGSWQLEQPHGFALDGDEAVSMSKLIPIYPLTAKLYSWDLQKVVSATLDLVTGVPDVLTPDLRERFEVLDVMKALRWIHLPDDWAQVGAAQTRFRFEEALVLQLVLAPASTTCSIARSATRVLPEPTSPCSRRFIGWSRPSSSATRSPISRWPPVSSNGSRASKAASSPSSRRERARAPCARCAARRRARTSWSTSASSKRKRFWAAPTCGSGSRCSTS